MAGKVISYNGKITSDIKEFVVDTEEEIQYLPNINRGGISIFADSLDFQNPVPMGSRVYYKDKDGNIQMQMLFSDGWTKFSVDGNII